MHDHLFENQHALEYDDLARHAVAIGLDVERFLRDMRDARHVEVVRANGQSAMTRGVTSTPTFFLNGELYEGSYEMPMLVAAIAEAEVPRTRPPAISPSPQR